MSEQSGIPQPTIEDANQQVPKSEKMALREGQKERVDAAVNFAHYLTSRYLQIDNMRNRTIEIDEGIHVELPELPEIVQVEPQLNYYLAGSLATTLLSRAETIELCEETNGSDIKIARSIAVPESTRTILAEFARPIGDIDYVPTAHYGELQQQVQNSFGKVSNEDYQQGRVKYLWKGGGGPKFGEIPADALPALKRQRDQGDTYGVMCDPIETYGTKKFARVKIEGQDYFVARPDTIVGYKILHMLQSYGQKPDKFNTDFARLYQAVNGLYTGEELVQLTHHILGEYEESMAKVSDLFKKPHEPKLPKMTQNLLGKPYLAQEARTFIGKIVAYDQEHGQILGLTTPLPPDAKVINSDSSVRG